jgi:hypothetical protein
VAARGAHQNRRPPRKSTPKITTKKDVVGRRVTLKAKNYGMVIYLSPSPEIPSGSDKNIECWKWFERNDVFAMLDKYKDYLVIDAVQEHTDPNANDWAVTCKTAIDRLRAKGYKNPLLMMSNDYGRNAGTVISKAAEVFNYDPLKNTFFNVQAYWDQSWDSPKKYSTELLLEQLPQLAALDYCVQIGVGAWAEGGPCDDAYVDYKTAMAECQRLQMGWLVWDWHNPYEWSHVFSVTTNGVYGNWNDHCANADVNDCRDNGKYGCDYGYQVCIGHAASIKNTSVKTCFMRAETNCSGGNTVTREYWSNITGTAVSAIPVTTTPTGTDQLSSLEGPLNWGDNYGTRIRALLKPSTTGAYTFYVSGDDNCELWLSTDDKPSNKVKIAEVIGWTNSKEWNKYSSQTSASRNLTANVNYYIEVLHKEGSGGDNVAAAWTGPGISSITVIGGSNLSAYSGGDTQPPSAPTSLTSPSKTSSSVSLSWTASTDNVSVTGYEIFIGSSTTAASTSTGTTSTVTGLSASTTYSFTVKAKDAANNLSAASNALSVTTNSSSSTTVTREYWSNITGTTVSSIPVTTTPSGTDQLSSLEGPINAGDNYGTRIRAFLKPTTSGAYTFYISGDDNCELWLGTDDKPSTKVKIAEVTGWTNSREWTKYTSQKSSSKNLTAGVNYYIELLHKEGTGGDNVAAGWTGPGISSITVIGGTNISPYVQAPTTAKLEAESATLSGGAGNHSGYSGTGFVDGYWAQGANTTFTYSAPSAGSYNVKLRYANGSGSAKSVSVYVNNVRIRQTALTNLADWSTWGDKTEALTLNGGSNTISYKYDAGDAGNVNIDFIEISSGTTTSTSGRMASVESEYPSEDPQEVNVNVYPNPADNFINVTLYAEKDQQAKIQLFDRTGGIRVSQEQKLTKGNNSFSINTSSLSDGLYILHVRSDQKQTLKKVMIVR